MFGLRNSAHTMIQTPWSNFIAQPQQETMGTAKCEIGSSVALRSTPVPLSVAI
ncbi:hypothetical protein CANTEDRAFT_114819 [Yamadazyma tenuis ATCC 10573]|uniref:Uncharacterized protein n=1 Tax=Candida tenuis (strain ATCC 10573 / BCRC 21748 / CBS 615 / JCM 9827 / NBRC 10315 / NRRL Y-1498 / VKM Y-70) TaxID=590646 RepID=G3B9Y5_CANTC|nr:uncharacterized protein CANTEDRAFT_114819 [Yamadazyma tenuis ATCC 10573]EGV61353.1 hypothetical protein CANTEDRAFT_114819 [Yamadazyma tenuis ATCC 10573]